MRLASPALSLALSLGLALALALPAGCDLWPREAAPSLESSPAATSTAACPDGDVSELGADALARCETWLASESQRLEGTADGVARSLRAAEVARLRALRAHDEGALERARGYLTDAARRRGIEGACDASLSLAELEARDRADLESAYLEAHRTVRRFDDGAHEACVARARRMLEVLVGARPSAAVLAAIDADPDADDPSIGLGSAPDAEASPSASSSGDAFAAWAAAQPTASSASLEGLSVYGGTGRSGSSRVVLSLSEVVRFDSSTLPSDGELPPRFVVLLPATSLGQEVAATTTVGAGGLVRVRASAEGPGTRVTLDLEPDASAVLFVLPEPFRVIVDVRRAGAESGAGESGESGAGESGESGAGESGPARGPHPMQLLVLDPGHGGDDFGARAFGLEEQDITLDLAVRVRDILRARLPSTRVVLTREENRFVSLEQRTAMANAVGADAFVSIHLNAAWEDVQHGGVTTFVLDTNDDRAAVRLAARENGTSELEVGALSRILAGLHREEQSAGSRALAERIHASTLASGRRALPRLYDRGVRSAMFYVLVGATMPAVLVEAAFMTRREEADALRTGPYRQLLAEGIADGIVAYARGAEPPTP